MWIFYSAVITWQHSSCIDIYYEYLSTPIYRSYFYAEQEPEFKTNVETFQDRTSIVQYMDDTIFEI